MLESHSNLVRTYTSSLCPLTTYFSPEQAMNKPGYARTGGGGVFIRTPNTHYNNFTK